MEWFLKVLKEHYADFDGRARRKEFWMYLLFFYIAIIAMSILVIVLGLIAEFLGYIFVGAMSLAMLALIIPNIAVVVRRLHDTGKSGWMLMVSFIPMVGGIWLLVMLCTEGNRGDNQYGPDPKANERIL